MHIYLVSDEPLDVIEMEDDPAIVTAFQQYLGGGIRAGRVDGQAYSGSINLEKVSAVVVGTTPGPDRMMSVYFKGRDKPVMLPLWSQDYTVGTPTPDEVFRRYLLKTGSKTFTYTRANYTVVIDLSQVVMLLYGKRPKGAF